MFYLIFKSFFKNQGLKLQSYKLMILVKNYSSSKILLYLKLSRQKQNKKMDLCRRYLNQIFVWAAKWLCMEKKKSKNKKLLWRWYLLSFNSGLFFFIFFYLDLVDLDPPVCCFYWSRWTSMIGVSLETIKKMKTGCVRASCT